MNDHLQRFFAAWMRHDSDEMAQFYAVDARMEDPTLAQPIDGRGAIRDYYANMYGSLENAEHELLDHAVNGDRQEADAMLFRAREARNELYDGREEEWAGGPIDLVFARFEPIAVR